MEVGIINQLNSGIITQMGRYTEKCVNSGCAQEMFILKKLQPVGRTGQFEHFKKFPWQPAGVHCSLTHSE